MLNKKCDTLNFVHVKTKMYQNLRSSHITQFE